jgi:eukaryotic-like serine/threonine-protein kinase
MSAPSAASPVPTVRLPRTFGRYVLFDFIGKGGMAEIFLARQNTDLGATRLCVVKQILPGLAGDSQFSEMLVHEAKLAARLSHANVVQVFDLGRADERLFITMEYVEGFDLNDLLRRCSRAKVPMPFELGVHVVREALRGLDYAHRRMDDDGQPLGIVHRDVSPSNLLVSFEGEVKVCDFGIAHANDVVASRDSQHEIDEAIRGKAGYMSPEHANGKPLDARADVYAAGIVLWELAAGRRMYRTGEGRDSLLEQARKAEVPKLPTAHLPKGDQLAAIVDKALARDRDARYPSAAAMLRDLEGYAAAARLMTSPLQLGDWLERTFGQEIVDKRRSRERAAAALERGAPVVVQAIAASSPAPRPAASPALATPPPPHVGAAVPVIPPPAALPATPASASRRGALLATIAVALVALAAVGTWLVTHRLH